MLNGTHTVHPMLATQTPGGQVVLGAWAREQHVGVIATARHTRAISCSWTLAPAGVPTWR